MSSEELNELVSTLAAAPARIQALVGNFSAEQLRRRPAADEFSFVQSVCHLRDLEVEGYTTRIKRILAEDRPVLADIDGGRLAIERDYNKQNSAEALRIFAQARAENVRALSELGLDELNREGTIEGVGIVKVERLLEMMSEHDAGHLDEIEQIHRRLTAHASHSVA
jgi:hypothetical protein